MPEKKRKVIFRRVKGRVIPIRVDENPGAVGFTQLGAAGAVGGGTAAFTGKRLKNIGRDQAVISRETKKAKALLKKSTRVKPQTRKNINKLLRAQVKNVSRFRKTTAVFGLGATAATFLTSRGFENLTKAGGGSEQTGDVAGSFASTAVGGILTATFLRKVPRPLQKLAFKSIKKVK